MFLESEQCLVRSHSFVKKVLIVIDKGRYGQPRTDKDRITGVQPRRSFDEGAAGPVYGFRFHPHYDTGFLDRGKEHAREVDPFVRRGSGEVISRKTYLSVLSRISEFPMSPFSLLRL